MLLEKNKKKRPTLKEFNEKYRIPDGCSAEIQDDAFTVKSLLTDIQLAMEIFFVANVTRGKDCVNVSFCNGKKFRLYLEEVKGK